MSTAYRKPRHDAMTGRCRGLVFSGKPSARGDLFDPVPGEFYDNRNGMTYQCIAPGQEPFSAVMENVKSGWRFVAHYVVQHEDGFIEWGMSTSGRFVR